MEPKFDAWVISAKKTLEWFIDTIGEDEWFRRRKNVAEYFHTLKQVTLTEADVQGEGFAKLMKPVAVYKDWICWYMYLVESIFERPGCDDPFQSSRIYPFFATIGNSIDALKKICGIENRLSSMFNERQNQPDSTLFELTIALLYHRNGWNVRFLDEKPGAKSPDLEVEYEGVKYWVECKRLAKVTDYAEKERLEWQTRSHHLFNALRLLDTFAYAEIIFKVPLETTDEVTLGAAIWHYVKSGLIDSGDVLSTDQIDFKATRLDISRINEDLLNSPTRPNSPHMVKLLIGEYDKHGNYTQLVAPSRIDTLYPDDELCVLNDFYGGVHQCYVARWESISEFAIDHKAKDIKKILIKAVDQIPQTGRGIVHIGYETVAGLNVEFRRQERIENTIHAFDFRGKDIVSVYCNAMQFLQDTDGVDWAETALPFERLPGTILKETLIFDSSLKDAHSGTHWSEDYKKKNSKL